MTYEKEKEVKEKRQLGDVSSGLFSRFDAIEFHLNFK